MAKHWNILVADDEEDLRWSLSKSLQRRGSPYHVTCVSDGNSALAELQERNYDLVVSDLRMPGVSGLELIREIRSRKPQVPIIVMTAYGSEEVQREAQRHNALYIEKPFDIGHLRELIRLTLQSPGKAATTQQH